MVRSLRIATLFGILAFSTLAARGEDWPMWRGPLRDGISKDTAAVPAWPAGGPKTVWSKNVGIGFATPVAMGGRVYAFAIAEDGKDTLYAFDAEKGTQAWKESYDSQFTGKLTGSMTGGWKGTRCSPIIENGRIYTHGYAGDLVCRELDTGKLVWHMNVLVACNTTPCEWGQASNPLIDGDSIYVGGGQGGAVAIAVNKKDGQVIWKSDKALGGYSAPILADVQGTKHLIVFGGNTVFALNPKTGKTIWKEPWKTMYDVNAASPVYRDGHLFISSNYDHGCMMLQLSPTGAKKLWETKDMKAHFQPPVLEGNVLYGNSQGSVRCLTWPDGKVVWTAKDRVGNGGSMLRVGDKLLLLGERGKLILAQANPKSYEKLGEAQIFDGNQIWSSPILYNGKLYAKGTEDFTCFDLSGK
jgi:outer membrane protein assembly factor BamB